MPRHGRNRKAKRTPREAPYERATCSAGHSLFVRKDRKTVRCPYCRGKKAVAEPKLAPSTNS